MSLKDAAVNAEALKVWNDLAYLRTSASLPPGVVIGLTVFDPRISFPPKMPRRVESVPEEADAVIQQHLSQWPEGVADSRIWDPAVVKDVNAKKPSEKALNKRRALALVPGTPLTPQKGDTRVPILLLQRNCLMQDSAGASRKESREFLSGWDVVVPKGWAMAFWKNFIFAGARVGGLRERHSFHFESGIPCFPYDFPETAASQEWWAQSRAAKQAVFDRTPKSKRPNFDKLRISSPFEPHFDALVGNGDALKIRPVEPVTGGKRSKKAKRNGKTASAKNAQTKKSTKQEQPDKTTAVQPAATPESGSAEAMEGVEPTPTTDALVPKQEQPDRTTAVQPAAAPESGSAEAMEGVEPTPTTDALVPSTQPTTPNLGKLVVINSPRGVTLLLAALSESSPTPIHDLLAQQISKLALQRFPDNSLSNVSASVYEKAMARVRLTMMLRGAPGDCGIVYAASREEYAFWSTAKKGQDFEMKAEKTMLDKFPPDSAIFGYITTGRFSLAEGHGQAIACCTIAGLQRVVEDGKR
ncbi:hypothetical protein HK104_008592 [Borealophlyctis nickersoniae]|nr:hypothetical protein HK104_008592 [Borealophlyctis nickersoniae]